MPKYIVVRDTEITTHEWYFPADKWTEDTARTAVLEDRVPNDINTDNYIDADFEVYQDEF